MKEMEPAPFSSGEQSGNISGYLYYAGFRYWAASILPALVGTTLPFWLRPPAFSFRWIAAIEFVIATVFMHSGFSFLLASVRSKAATSLSENRLIKYASIFIVAGCLLGLHLNSNLILRSGVPEYIFILYGLTALFAGALYVLPPFSFHRRAGGEIVIAEGLGMLPLIGAYLVQVGDITRKVYLASLPLVIATGLWVWMDELARSADDERTGRNTMVTELGPRFCGRYGVSALSLLFILAIILSVFSGSVSPLTLISLLSAGIAWKMVIVSWKEYSFPERMLEMRRLASILHFAAGSILAASSLITMLLENR